MPKVVLKSSKLSIIGFKVGTLRYIAMAAKKRSTIAVVIDFIAVETVKYIKRLIIELN